MRRSYFTIFLAVGLGALLLLLGFLQYRWQSEISENEAQRLHRSVQESAGRFAEDFNREIQNAYFNFQIGVDDWRAGNYGPFLERYNFWKGKTAYPGLISGFYFFDAAGKNEPLRFDPTTSTFVQADWSQDLRNIFQRTRDEKSFRAVNEDIYTLIVPQNEAPPRFKHIVIRREPAEVEIGDRSSEISPRGEAPKTYGYLALRLDENILRSALLPAIAAKEFGDGDYRVKVIDRNGSTVFQTADITGNSDASASLFQLSANDIIFFANRDLATAVAEKKESVMMSTHVESRTMSRTEVKNNSQGTVNLQIERGGAPKTEIFTTAKSDEPEPHWKLEVQHTAGSIDEYIAAQKTRSLAAGFGILGLLGLAAGAIMFSAQRAKAFAQRQVDFVSSVSHEFRTPLAVIYSAGENLADGVTTDTEKTSKYGELIKSEGRKLSAMVEQILEFAGANSGKRKYNLQPTWVPDLVETAIAECAALLAEHGMRIERNIDASLPLVNADREALSRAIQNLIANSIKYGNGSDLVRISARNSNGRVRIVVEDHGISISGEDLRQIFEPFYRSREVVDAQIHGNGLGLSIVKQIVEAHGGRITAESEPGAGSKFTIELAASENA